ncbi:hypothetical protein E0L36_17865 [Streptomyces sp. AJS327]|uniref:hypothetical protein n=1 Tax=Streptomyces sp. AJS327 TaxID=2545265 RepID=UPI0015DEB8E6|nr:hypothetical protein [Streptomyces sp. AJS327]MBA0052678.1 hypothetical protein [Streptomyces sp. AJS327]
MSSVLVIGYDPRALPEGDGERVRAALEAELARFAEHGVEVGTALVKDDAAAESVLVAALRERPWRVVVIGGGIRQDPALLPLFERIVNLVRRHAPRAAVAFNSGVTDTVDAALRWL